MTILWFDCETYSEVDLKKHGTHVYAAHPSTEITVAQWAIDDGEPVVLDCTAIKVGDYRMDYLSVYLRDPAVEVRAHNSHFDRTLLRHCWDIDVPVERWYDTMVQAYAHSLPGGLDKLCQALGLPVDLAKDKRGAQLIQLFCKPRPANSKLRRATDATHPDEWAEFLEYSRQDIISMREVSRRLPKWNYNTDTEVGKRELALWHLDQKINDRGFAVDTVLARAAIAATDVEKARLKTEVRAATQNAVSSPSKRDEMLAFILAEHGVDLPDMKADTLRRRMEDPDLPDPVRLLIGIRLEATKTSTAKYQALVNASSEDCRLRNSLQFGGANRTNRWSGRIFQPQNLPRPEGWFTGEEQELAVEALKAGFATEIYSDVMRLTSNAIRGVIVAPPGKKLVVADLANIEGRMLAWLAGEDWKLAAFRRYDAGTGPDLYNVAYGRSFNVDPAGISKAQRQIGKVQELALGYEGGVAAFLTFAAVYRMDLDQLTDAVHSTAPREALAQGYAIYEWTLKKKRSTFGLSKETFVACEVLKASWRNAHPMVVLLWSAAKDAVQAAVLNPGLTFDIGKHLRARVDGAWLRIRLPSGRYLCYLNPKVDDSGQITYTGVNPYTRQWGRVKTYGGKLIENATQAAARDVLAANMPAVEEHGFEIALTVHDELITEAKDRDLWNNHRLAALMSRVPEWAEGLPLAAAGFEAYRYRKE